MKQLIFKVNGKEEFTRTLVEDNPFTYTGVFADYISSFSKSDFISLDFQISGQYFEMEISCYKKAGKLGLTAEKIDTGKLIIKLFKTGNHRNIGVTFSDNVLCRSAEIIDSLGILDGLGNKINSLASSENPIDLIFSGEGAKLKHTLSLYINGDCTDLLSFNGHGIFS